jgi:hypothetical protein
MDIDEVSYRARRVKERATIFDAAKLCGLEIRYPNTTSQLKCPFHGEDAHPSARIYSDTNKFWCFKCQIVLDQIGLITKVKEISFLDAIRAIEQHLGLPALQPEVLESSFILPSDSTSGGVEPMVRLRLDQSRNFLSLSQYIVVWQYFDELLILNSKQEISKKDVQKHLSEYLQKLNKILENVVS